jgi:uncharacterized protein YraI
VCFITKCRFALISLVLPVLASSAFGETYRVNPNAMAVDDGYLNMRSGPGQKHDIITSIPAGSEVQRGSCVQADDGISTFPWCKVRWNGHIGWVSSGGLETGASQVGRRADQPEKGVNDTNIESDQDRIFRGLEQR